MQPSPLNCILISLHIQIINLDFNIPPLSFSNWYSVCFSSSVGTFPFYIISHICFKQGSSSGISVYTIKHLGVHMLLKKSYATNTLALVKISLMSNMELNCRQAGSSFQVC